MKPSRILLVATALIGFAAGCQRMEARRPLSETPSYAIPPASEGSGPAYRPSEGS